MDAEIQRLTDEYEALQSYADELELQNQELKDELGHGAEPEDDGLCKVSEEASQSGHETY